MSTYRFKVGDRAVFVTEPWCDGAARNVGLTGVITSAAKAGTVVGIRADGDPFQFRFQGEVQCLPHMYVCSAHLALATHCREDTA